MTRKPTTIGVARPPRGSVKITPGEDAYTVKCGSCGWSYRATIKADANDQKRWHQCAVAS